MKVNKLKNKISLVLDPQELLAIGVCLAESPVLSNRKLAFKLREAMDKAHEKNGN